MECGPLGLIHDALLPRACGALPLCRAVSMKQVRVLLLLMSNEDTGLFARLPIIVSRRQ